MTTKYYKAMMFELFLLKKQQHYFIEHKKKNRSSENNMHALIVLDATVKKAKNKCVFAKISREAYALKI